MKALEELYESPLPRYHRLGAVSGLLRTIKLDKRPIGAMLAGKIQKIGHS